MDSKIRQELTSILKTLQTLQQKIAVTESRITHYLTTGEPGQTFDFGIFAGDKTACEILESRDFFDAFWMSRHEGHTRIVNRLKYNGITTFDQLLDRWEDEGEKGLLRIRQFGDKALVDVKEVILSLQEWISRKKQEKTED